MLKENLMPAAEQEIVQTDFEMEIRLVSMRSGHAFVQRPD